jgi:hypothetical protein
VAEHLQAGVACTAEGKGAVSDHSDLSLGAAFWRDSPLRAHIHEADVVLAVGTRLALVTFRPGTPIIQIDTDEREIGRSHKDTLGLVGDARATLEALLERLRAASGPRPSRKAEHEALRARIAADNAMEPNAPSSNARAWHPENAIGRRRPRSATTAPVLAGLRAADVSPRLTRQPATFIRWRRRRSPVRPPGGPVSGDGGIPSTRRSFHRRHINVSRPSSTTARMATGARSR